MERKNTGGKQHGVNTRPSSSGPRTGMRPDEHARGSRASSGTKNEKTPEWMDFDVGSAATDFDLGGGLEDDDMAKFRAQMKLESLQNGGQEGNFSSPSHGEEYIPENTRDIEKTGSPADFGDIPVDQMFGRQAGFTKANIPRPEAGKSRFAAFFDNNNAGKEASSGIPPPRGINTHQENLEGATAQLQAMLSINPTQKPVSNAPSNSLHRNHRPPPPQQRYYPAMEHRQRPPPGLLPQQQFQRPTLGSPDRGFSGPPMHQQPNPSSDGPDMQRIMSMLARVSLPL